MSDTLFPDHEGYFKGMSPVAASYVQSQHGKPDPIDVVAQARQAELDQQQGQSMPPIQLLSTGTSPESSSSISGAETKRYPLQVQSKLNRQNLSKRFLMGSPTASTKGIKK